MFSPNYSARTPAAMLGSAWRLSRSILIIGLLFFPLTFSFSLMAITLIITRSLLPPMAPPGNVLVFGLFVLDYDVCS